MRSQILFLLFLAAPAACVAQNGVGPTGTVDSVVVTRKSDLCGMVPCPTSRVSLRRSEFPGGELDRLASKARADGLYRLPSSILGTVPWCQVVYSDAIMATIAIHHRDGSWTIRGYHHCLGPKGIPTHERVEMPAEKRRLIQLEASIDSLAAIRRQ